ncbi:MAG TPA: DMT family transporter [Patescibacteria group bacterium]|nr:DMT family transporter [Patescibacteria group bacterium]
MEKVITPSVLFGLLAMFGWGTGSFVVASLTKKFGVFKVGFLIQILAFFPTLLLLPIIKEELILNQTWFYLSLIALIGSLAYISILKSYEQGIISIVVPLSSVWAIITAILSFIFLKESVVPIKIIGMSIAIIGIILISTDFRKVLKEKKIKIYKGVKWASLAALAWGVEMFLLAFFSRKLGWYTANLGLRFWNLVIFFLLAVLIKQKIPLLFKKIPRLIWLAILIDVFTLTTYNLGLVRGEPGVVSVIASTSPLITIILATLFFKEKIELIQKIGIFLILAGIASLSLV